MVSGVGKVAAAAASASLLARPGVDWLINVGICGVLVDRADLAHAVLLGVESNDLFVDLFANAGHALWIGGIAWSWCVPLIAARGGVRAPRGDLLSSSLNSSSSPVCIAVNNKPV